MRNLRAFILANFIILIFTIPLSAQSVEEEELEKPDIPIEEVNVLPETETETETETEKPDNMAQTEDKPSEATSQKSEGFNLENELKVDLEILKENLDNSSLKFKTWKGLAITGYSLTGLGIGLVVVDSLAATPNEIATDPHKFKELSWSAIPITIIGLAMGVTFNILEEREEDRKMIIEGDFYDVKSELEILQLQLYGADYVAENIDSNEPGIE